MTAVSVVVPTWNRATWLDGCLDALATQALPPEEVIVVGRDGDPRARTIAEAHRERGLPVRWVGGARPGHVEPIRRGLASVTSELVAFVDDDVVPDERWLEELVACLDEPRVACVGGRVVTPGFRGAIHADAGSIRWYGRHIGNIGAVEAPAPREVVAVMEGNCAWRTEVLRQLEFDARLDSDDASMYGLDLSLQAVDRGYRVVYTSAARVEVVPAPRDPALDREDRVARAFTYNRNYTLIGLRRFRGIRRWVFPVWWVIVGERGGYGLVTGALDLVVRGRSTWPLVRRSFRGKWEGFRLWAGR